MITCSTSRLFRIFPRITVPYPNLLVINSISRYLENGACVSVGDIYDLRQQHGKTGPIYPFDEATGQIADSVTGSWYLESSLYISEGSTLVAQGTEFGGDCDHLLLLSNPLKIINLRAHGGNIYIEGTHVESWDMDLGQVDENFEDGRR